MPKRIENIRVKCPKCLMPHDYRIIVDYKIISSLEPVARDTEKISFEVTLYCPGLKEDYDSIIPIHYSKNERINNVQVKY